MLDTATLDHLLTKTSRTFALAIPLLEEPTRRAVSLAYLVLRLADTFEDATEWGRAERVAALDAFARLLGPQTSEPTARASSADGRASAEAASLTARWLAAPPTRSPALLELLARTPDVMASLDALAPSARAIVARHARRTTDGMALVVARADERGSLRLSSVEELRDYCYTVAGIVGELLTEIFLHDAPSLAAERAELERTMVAFGEGLQLVNILKDSEGDAKEGRAYLPPGASRAEVLALAREDLALGQAYLSALVRGRAPRGTVGFCALLLTLATAALDRVEARGAGAKIAREDVLRMHDEARDFARRAQGQR